MTQSGKGTAGRSLARLYAVQAVYQLFMEGGTVDSVLRTMIHGRLTDDEAGGDLGDPDGALLADLVRGAWIRREELEGMVSHSLPSDWPLDRIELILRALLDVAALELLEHSGTPARVIIAEYVDVAHAFFEKGETGMVNGVLDHLARILRPDELGASRGRAGG